MTFDYSEYVALFNTGDDAALVDRFFVDVPVFVHYTLRDGLISRIRVARAGEPSMPSRG